MKNDKIETLAQFKIAVNKAVKDLMKEDASDVHNIIRSQDLYRHGGIKYMPFSQLLREIAIARVLEIEFTDEITDKRAFEKYQELN